MNRLVIIYLSFILCISISLALQVTITADFNNTKPVDRLGTLDWFIEPVNSGEAINVTGYCLEEDASKITIPQKQQNGQPGTVRKTCTVTNTELLKQYSPFYTYATFSYMQPETIDGSPKIVYYTFPTPKSKMFGFNNFIEDAVSKSFDWLASIFGIKKTCDKDPSVCTVGDFCYLTDQATTDLNTVEKMNQRLNDDPTLKARIKQSFLIIDESPDGYGRGCLPKSMKEYFSAMHIQSSENTPHIYDTGAYVTYDKDTYNVLIYSHVKGANSLACSMSFSLGDQTLSQARVYPGFVSDLIYDSEVFSIPEPAGDVAFNAILTCDGVQKDTSSGFVKTRFFTEAKSLVRAESGTDEVLTVKSVNCASYTTKETCPSASCEWTDAPLWGLTELIGMTGECKDKPTNAETEDKKEEVKTEEPAIEPIEEELPEEEPLEEDYLGGGNIKDTGKYTSKQAFLISDENWKDALPWVPVAVWTEGPKIQKYPLLFWHAAEADDNYTLEKDRYDTGRISNFLSQRPSDRVVSIGEMPPEAEEKLGKSTPSVSVSEKISVSDYLSYWKEYRDVIYAEDSYEISLVASSFASLVNAPLIIQGSLADTDANFEGKNVVCVGSSLERRCDHNFDLEGLRKEYIRLTGTNKIIMIAPKDILREGYYNKGSLASPILAGAKHEVIIGVDTADKDQIKSVIKTWVERLGSSNPYLTIIASPQEIPYDYPCGYYPDYPDIPTLCAMDPIYADINDDGYMEVSEGRINIAHSTGLSAYIARAIFYDEIKLKSDSTLALDYFGGTGMDIWKEMLPEYFDNYLFYGTKGNGYGSKNNGPATDSLTLGAADKSLLGKTYLYIHSHGNEGGIGGGYVTGFENYMDYYTEHKDYLDNPVFFPEGCSTCAGAGDTSRKLDKYSHDILCFYAIEGGAIAYVGPVREYDQSAFSSYSFFYRLYSEDKPIGELFKESVNNFIANGEYEYGAQGAHCEDNGEVILPKTILILNGDPTIKYGYPLRLTTKEAKLKKLACVPNENLGKQGEIMGGTIPKYVLSGELY